MKRKIKMTIFSKLKVKRQLETKKNYKKEPKTKTTEIQNTSMATINEADTISTTGGNKTTGNKDR